MNKYKKYCSTSIDPQEELIKQLRRLSKVYFIPAKFITSTVREGKMRTIIRQADRLQAIGDVLRVCNGSFLRSRIEFSIT